MPKSIAIAIGMAILSFNAPAQGEMQLNLRLGYVDIQKALNLCDAGKDAADKLNKELENAKNKYEKQGEELKREKETLERQAPLLQEDVLQDKMRDFRAKYRDWERFRRDTENDIKQEHNEMVDRISKELIEIADRIGNEEKYTLIVERSLVPYINPSLDLTDEVVTLHNEQDRKKRQ